MNQRTKNIILVAGFLLMLLLAYNYAISETIELRKLNRSLESQTLNSEELNRLSISLNDRTRFADSILVLNNIKSASLQNNLLAFLNESSSESLRIESFNEPHVFKNEELERISYSFSLIGSYENIQDVLYKLEQEYNFGKVVHVDFEKKRDYRRGRDFLECFVIISRVSNNQ